MAQAGRTTGNTREQIIDTAFQLLLQRGLNGFSYRDISKPLGVRNAAIHYHFPSKMDLIKALIEKNHAFLRKNSAEFMAYGGPALPQLDGFFQFAREQFDCGRPVCIAGALSVEFEDLPEKLREALDRFTQDSVDWLARVLETGRKQKEFDFRGDPRDKAIAVIATVQGARQIARIHGKKLLECTFRQIRTDLGIED